MSVFLQLQKGRREIIEEEHVSDVRVFSLEEIKGTRKAETNVFRAPEITVLNTNDIKSSTKTRGRIKQKVPEAGRGACEEAVLKDTEN